MFLSKHRLNIASLRIGKHRIAKKSENRPPLVLKTSLFDRFPSIPCTGQHERKVDQLQEIKQQSALFPLYHRSHVCLELENTRDPRECENWKKGFVLALNPVHSAQCKCKLHSTQWSISSRATSARAFQGNIAKEGLMSERC